MQICMCFNLYADTCLFVYRHFDNITGKSPTKDLLLRLFFVCHDDKRALLYVTMSVKYRQCAGRPATVRLKKPPGRRTSAKDIRVVIGRRLKYRRRPAPVRYMTTKEKMMKSASMPGQFLNSPVFCTLLKSQGGRFIFFSIRSLNWNIYTQKLHIGHFYFAVFSTSMKPVFSKDFSVFTDICSYRNPLNLARLLCCAVIQLLISTFPV